VESLAEELKRYEEETLHLFRRRDWDYAWGLTRS
jgi:hypothetical protein